MQTARVTGRTCTTCIQGCCTSWRRRSVKIFQTIIHLRIVFCVKHCILISLPFFMLLFFIFALYVLEYIYKMILRKDRYCKIYTWSLFCIFNVFSDGSYLFLLTSSFCQVDMKRRRVKVHVEHDAVRSDRMLWFEVMIPDNLKNKMHPLANSVSW